MRGGSILGDIVFTNPLVDKDNHPPQAFCRKCGGAGKIYCEKCDGSGVEECTTCGGDGRLTCEKCHGDGELTCSKCDGDGELTCSKCDGKGYIPYIYHLIQSQKRDALDLIWSDDGIGKVLDFKKYAAYPTQVVFDKSTDNDSQVEIDDFPHFSAAFRDELQSKWAENFEKYNGVSDIFIRGQNVKFAIHDALIKFEYKYNGKDYSIWIDITSGEVFEGETGGLMSEWGAQVAEGGDKIASKNPQEAIHQYAMACAITADNKLPASKLRKQLCLGSWLFRLAAGCIGGWLWSVFMKTHGRAPEEGWYIMGAMIAVDILFAQRRFWMQLIGAGALWYAACYVLPEFGGTYIVCSTLLFVSTSLLFARDFALRMRGGVYVFPILGALVGAATAPSSPRSLRWCSWESWPGRRR